MIIILKNADFSQSNIGTLSTWRITRSLGAGATYEGPISVDKGAAFSATIYIAQGYELGSAGITVTMNGNLLNDVISDAGLGGGGEAIFSGVYEIDIASVTGNVVIKVPTVNINTGEEEEPEVPDTPVTPPSGTVTWYLNHNTEIGNSGKEITSGAALNNSAGSFAYQEAIQNELIGKPINVVECFVNTAGTFTFSRWNSSAKTVVPIQTFNLANTNAKQTLVFNEPFILESNEYLAFGNPTDTGKIWYYSTDLSGVHSSKITMKILDGQTTQAATGVVNVAMNIGYNG